MCAGTQAAIWQLIQSEYVSATSHQQLPQPPQQESPVSKHTVRDAGSPASVEDWQRQYDQSQEDSKNTPSLMRPPH
jgi:hypothetical protein